MTARDGQVFPGEGHADKEAVMKAFLAIAAASILIGICAGPASAGETKADRRLGQMGITVQAADRNAALIRRYESRKTRNIEKQTAPFSGEVYIVP